MGNLKTSEVKDAWWFPIWEFLIHILVGVFIFMLITLAVVALHLMVQWIKQLQISTFMERTLVVVEYVLFVGDVILFTWFFLKSLWKAIRTI
jgi:hypothetical protein